MSCFVYICIEILFELLYEEKIKDICSLQAGIHLKVDKEVGSDSKGYLVNLRDFDENSSFIGANVKVNASKVKEKCFVGEDDILFSTRVRFNAYRIPSNEGNYIASNSFVILKTDRGKILPGFLVWALNHPKMQNKIQHIVGSQSRVPFLRVSLLEELRINVPALEIQQKIVELGELKNKERELTERILSLKEQYIQTILLKQSKS